MPVKLLALLLVLTGCAAGQPALVAAPLQSVEIFAGTAVGDPCTPDGMQLNFPAGLPRICTAGKWVPLCSSTADAAKNETLCASLTEPKHVD